MLKVQHLGVISTIPTYCQSSALQMFHLTTKQNLAMNSLQQSAYSMIGEMKRTESLPAIHRLHTI